MIKKNYQYTDKTERIEYRKETYARDIKISLNKEKKRGGKKKREKDKKKNSGKKNVIIIIVLFGDALWCDDVCW